MELTTNISGKKITYEENKIRQYFSDRLKEMKRTELSDDELKIFAEEIKNMSKDKYQHTMENF